MGAELKGIANSIEALIALFNQKIDESLTGHDCPMQLPPDQYRSIFKADLQKLDDLIHREIE